MNIELLTAAVHVFEKYRGIELTTLDRELIADCGYSDASSDDLMNQLLTFLDSDVYCEPQIRI